MAGEEEVVGGGSRRRRRRERWTGNWKVGWQSRENEQNRRSPCVFCWWIEFIGLYSKAHKFWSQVSPATIRKSDVKALEKEPNSIGSSSRKVLTPTMESDGKGWY
jgi:hypothetical protein